MKKIFSTLLISLAFCSCGDFDEINLNPDTPTTVTPDFLATNVILKTTESITGKHFFVRNTWSGTFTISLNVPVFLGMVI